MVTDMFAGIVTKLVTLFLLAKLGTPSLVRMLGRGLVNWAQTFSTLAYTTCVSSKLCKFIVFSSDVNIFSHGFYISPGVQFKRIPHNMEDMNNANMASVYLPEIRIG